ncbi:MAG: OmpA family protein [Ferruginibacter sp.]
MKLIAFLLNFCLCLSFSPVVFAQNAALPKDAPVDVTVTDFKNKILSNELVIFRSLDHDREYQGVSGEDGKVTLRLPAGDSYEMYVFGFKDSTAHNMLEIPALKANAYYKDPFKVKIQFQPSKTFILQDCNFETGKTNLEPESYAVLDELVAYLKRKEDVRIEVGGHTDNVGKAASNLALSKDRAQAVMDYLIAKGIDPARLEAKGYGMTVPVEDNNSEEGRAQNRRTEIKVLD